MWGDHYLWGIRQTIIVYFWASGQTIIVYFSLTFLYLFLFFIQSGQPLFLYLQTLKPWPAQSPREGRGDGRGTQALSPKELSSHRSRPNRRESWEMQGKRWVSDQSGLCHTRKKKYTERNNDSPSLILKWATLTWSQWCSGFGKREQYDYLRRKGQSGRVSEWNPCPQNREATDDV